MKRKTILILLAIGALGAVTLTGCSSKKSTSATEQSADNSDEIITGYLVQDANKHLTLGDYTDMEVSQTVLTITDELVESEMLTRLSDYAAPEEVTTGAEYMDTINMDMTAGPKGEEPGTQTDYSFDLGNQEFGPDFDDKMMGVKAGDHLTFTLDYTDSEFVQNWAGHEVDFDVTVNSVTRTATPELSEEFVKENLGYDSIEDYRQAVREEMETTNEAQSQHTLIMQAINNAEQLTEFKSIPKTLYDSIESSMLNQDQLIAESMNMSLGEYQSYMELTTEDTQARVLDEAHLRLFLSAYCQKNGLDLTQSDYRDYLDRNYAYYGYTDAQSFEDATGMDVAIWSAYQELVGNDLLHTAQIVDISMDYTAEEMAVPENPETDADVVVNGLDDAYEEVIN